jgi:hypothetical protein
MNSYDSAIFGVLDILNGAQVFDNSGKQSPYPTAKNPEKSYFFATHIATCLRCLSIATVPFDMRLYSPSP